MSDNIVPTLDEVLTLIADEREIASRPQRSEDRPAPVRPCERCDRPTANRVLAEEEDFRDAIPLCMRCISTMIREIIDASRRRLKDRPET